MEDVLNEVVSSDDLKVSKRDNNYNYLLQQYV